MVDLMLQDLRILVVEDEYFLADHLQFELGEEGAIVLGPAATVEDALDLIAREPRIDAVLLDLNLGGVKAFPVADLLINRGVPIVLTTGFDRSVLPSAYANLLHCEKPINIPALKRTLAEATRV